MSLLVLRRPASVLVAAGMLLAACAPAAQPTPTQAPAPPTQAGQPTAAAPSGGASPTAAPPAASPAAVPSPAAQAGTTTGGGGGVLVRAELASLAKSLHPFPPDDAYTSSWTDIAALIWGQQGGGSLVELDWDTLEWKPALAKEVPTSPDGKTFTFTLRDDLKWSDGRPITADDFLFAWENVSKKENAWVSYDNVEEVESFTTPDPKTVKIVLKQPKPRHVGLGITSSFGPVPKHVWQGKSWTDATQNPEILNPTVVLGPFKIQEFKIAERAVLVPIDTYYKGKPKLDRIEFLPSQQPTVAFEQLKAGRANWAPNIPPAQYRDAKADPNLTMYEWTAANASYRTIEFNLTNAFLSDKNVREALVRAVNRQDVLDVAEEGLGLPQYSFVTPTNTRWYNPNVNKHDFDMNQAKQLLQQAGYQTQNGRLLGKDGQPVTLRVFWPTSSAPRGKIATYLQQQWKELGIEVDVRGLDFNAFTDQVRARRDYEISLGTWGGGDIDPDLGSKPQHITGGQQNSYGYSNPRVDELFRQGQNELDDAKRKQIYDELQSIIADDMPQFYLYALNSFSPASKKVQGIKPTKGDRLYYNDALMQWSVSQ